MYRLFKYLNLRLFSSLTVFILSQCFFIWLTVSSCQDFRQQNLKNLISLSVDATASKIGTITSLGRTVENYQAIHSDLYNLKMLSKTDDAFVLNANGKIIAGKSVTGLTELDLSLIKDHLLNIGNHSYRLSPFYNVKGAIDGYVAASLSPDPYATKTSMQLSEYFYLRVGIMLALSCFICACFTIKSQLKEKQTGKKGGVKSFLAAFFVAQILVLSVVVPQIKNWMGEYINLSNSTIASFIQKQFDQVSKLEINLNDISGLPEFVGKVKAQLPSIGKLSIADAQKKIIAGDTDITRSSVSMPIFGQSSNQILGYIELKENRGLLTKFTINLTLTLFTLFVISAIFAFELSSLVSLELARLKKALRKTIPFEVQLPRPISFLLIFALYMPITVTPIYMGRFAADFGDLNYDVVRSLPISAEMLAIGFSSLVMLLLSRKLGWQKSMKLGIILTTVGMAVSFTANNGYIFLISRFCCGLGYGALIVSLQLCVVAITETRNRGQGFSGIMAGLYSGVLCGGCVGGLLAEKFGYANIYLFSALFLAVDFLIIHSLFLKREIKIHIQENQSDVGKTQLDFGQILRFISDRKVCSLIFFQAIPYAAITIGFFNFFMPIYVTQKGFGTDTVGQFNFLYSLLIILLSPLVGKILDKAKRKYLILSLGLLCSTIVPLIFKLDLTLISPILAMLFLGISASINEGGQPFMISSYKSAEKIGESNAVMLLDSILRAGQVAGPLLVAVLFANFGSIAFAYLSIAVGMLLILFTAIQRGADD